MNHQELEHTILSANVSLIRAIYAGPEGVIRGKAFTPRFLAEVLEGGIGLTQAQTSVTVLDQLPPNSEFQPVGEVRLRPDTTTFQLLPYLPGHARMLADLETLDGEPFALCPRSLLRQMLDRLSDRGLTLCAAFENEFTAFEERDGAWQPLDELNCFSSAAMDRASHLILPIIEALEEQGILVEKYYPEAGFGQQEIPVRYETGLAAADQQVVFRETVRGTAESKGYRVSYMPKPHSAAAGNGCHIHFSLWDQTQENNLFYDPEEQFQLSALARNFIAGVLKHIDSVMAFTAPTTNSYARFQKRCWSSHCASWGPDNREATIRVASPFYGQVSSSVNLEFKPSDPTNNPYLALSAILAAGLDGIERDLQPPQPLLTDPALLSPEELAAGAMTPYPQNLADAIDALEKNPWMSSVLGETRVKDYIVMKRAEIAAFESMDPADQEAALLFRF